VIVGGLLCQGLFSLGKKRQALAAVLKTTVLPPIGTSPFWIS
jgi:hypothetical protein